MRRGAPPAHRTGASVLRRPAGRAAPSRPRAPVPQGERDRRRGLRALAEGQGLPALSTLELTFNRDITGGGVAALARAERFRAVETLWLRQCPAIGSDGAAALARSPHAAGLRELNLLHCGIGAEGAAALADSPHLDGLTRLLLQGNDLDDASRERLRARFGSRVEL